jgi:hypothetical protein
MAPREVYSGDLHLTEEPGYSDLFLQFVPDCQKGVRLTYDPPSAVRTDAQAKAHDGGVVAVRFAIRQRHFTIKVARPDGTASTLTVDLRPDAYVIPS